MTAALALREGVTKLQRKQPHPANERPGSLVTPSRLSPSVGSTVSQSLCQALPPQLSFKGCF